MAAGARPYRKPSAARLPPETSRPTGSRYCCKWLSLLWCATPNARAAYRLCEQLLQNCEYLLQNVPPNPSARHWRIAAPLCEHATRSRRVRPWRNRNSHRTCNSAICRDSEAICAEASADVICQRNLPNPKGKSLSGVCARPSAHQTIAANAAAIGNNLIPLPILRPSPRYHQFRKVGARELSARALVRSDHLL
jgi:hypothetical protein